MSVRQMLSTMDSHEISEWMAYFSLTSGKGSMLKNTVDDKIKSYFSLKRKKT